MEVGWARFSDSRGAQGGSGDVGWRWRTRREGEGGGGDGLSSACKYFTLHSSQFSFRLGVSQSHNFASTPGVGHSPPPPVPLSSLSLPSSPPRHLFASRLVPLLANT